MKEKEDQKAKGNRPDDRPVGRPDKHHGKPDDRPVGPPNDRPIVPPIRPVKPTNPFGSDGEPDGLPAHIDQDTWWEKDRQRFELEASLMAEHYSQFTWSIENGSKKRLRWDGIICPWPSTTKEAAAVIACLGRNETVGCQLGHIKMLPGVTWTIERKPGWLRSDLLAENFRIRVYHRSPPANPSAFLIEPVLERSPHRYAPDGSICPLTPQNNEWSWGTHMLIDYLDAVAIWILKTSVWVRSDGRIWLGNDTPHDLASLLKTPSLAPCICGSGKPFGSCCRRRLLQQL